MGAGLARVTIAAPHRRVDLALPDQIPLAELLPDLLRHAGESLADEGERHGGWLLRRPDGAPLLGGRPLRAQGIRDGEILHLTPARAHWPEPEYDDVVDVIAGAPGRTGRWSPAATRVATRAAATVLLLATLPSLLLTTPSPVPAALALALLLAAVTASRAYGDAGTAATLGALSLPFAALAGAQLTTMEPAARWGAPEALVAAVSVLATALLVAVGTAVHLRIPVAAMTAALPVAATAAAALAFSPVHAAAVLLTATACALGLLPLLAIRLGRLPIPPIALPGDDDPFQQARQRPPRDEVLAALTRTDEFLTGLLAGHALVVAGSALFLTLHGGLAARLLAGAAALGLLLRARTFAAAHHRVPPVCAAVAVLAALAITVPPPVVAAVALGVLAGGATWSRRPPSLYLARSGEILETLTLVSLIPLTCAVLDLYTNLRNLNG
ncbi:type VII secretion integral membrane protein EccD [Catenuloplanes japonicus]|uniref:type VII secretion integral membrane protein EccD n=1 Tax=Catenuloplanes japonicus TaxID=33876 RepID=UPI0005251887|nr:type VII secretion integral membrane protein EccD [Catenuloplanes japonicus]